MIDTVAGRLQVVGDGLPSALPAILDGRLRAIAVMSEERVRLLPEVPTFVELGMGEVGKSAWFGLIAPAGTPVPIVAQLNQAVHAVMHDPEVATALARSGGLPATGHPESFEQTIRETLSAYRQVVAARKQIRDLRSLDKPRAAKHFTEAVQPKCFNYARSQSS